MSKLDHKLNLVLPFDRDDDSKLYVFTSPIRRPIFEFYYLVMSKAFTKIYSDNLNVFAGPRVAALMLRDAAQQTPRPNSDYDNWWVGPDGVELGLLGEFRRLSNVLVPAAEGGWTQMMYDDAVKRNLLDEDEVAEVEGAICFFMLNWSMHTRDRRKFMLESAAEMWGWQLTLSTLMEFKSGLQTSTTTVISTQEETPSSIPR